jgi:hypothetical protein
MSSKKRKQQTEEVFVAILIHKQAEDYEDIVDVLGVYKTRKLALKTLNDEMASIVVQIKMDKDDSSGLLPMEMMENISKKLKAKLEPMTPEQRLEYLAERVGDDYEPIINARTLV